MLIFVLRFPVSLSGDCKIYSVRNCIPRTCRGVEGVLCEGKSVSWGGARTKGEVRGCELTKKTFLHSDLLKLCPKKKHNITEFYPDTTLFYD